MVDFQVEVIAGHNLYRIIGKAGSHERRLLFRLDGRFRVEVVRFNEGKGVEVKISLLARDSASGDWLICEGVAKIAPNYPPGEVLKVVERIPNAAESMESALSTISDIAAKPAPEPSAPTLLTQPTYVPEDNSLNVKVAEIDNRIRALLAELAELNDEKTQLLSATLKPSNEASR